MTVSVIQSYVPLISIIHVQTMIGWIIQKNKLSNPFYSTRLPKTPAGVSELIGNRSGNLPGGNRVHTVIVVYIITEFIQQVG